MPKTENWTMASKKIHLKSLLCSLMWISLFPQHLMQQMWAPTGPVLWDLTRTEMDKHYNSQQHCRGNADD